MRPARRTDSRPSGGSRSRCQPAPAGIATETPPTAGNQFGAQVAWGDFDGDGFDDFVSSSPFGGVAAKADAGSFTLFTAVNLYAGTPTTKYARGSTNPVVAGTPGVSDKLGSAFAVGDFDADGYEDLAVGAPGDSTKPGGSVQVFYGGPGVQPFATST